VNALAGIEGVAAPLKKTAAGLKKGVGRKDYPSII
jgi:hypothetical protein